MQLYEANSSWCGESYVRMYVWATCPQHAIELVLERIKGTKYAESEWPLTELFDEASQPFCTSPSDDGFEKEGQYVDLFSELVPRDNGSVKEGV